MNNVDETQLADCVVLVITVINKLHFNIDNNLSNKCNVTAALEQVHKLISGLTKKVNVHFLQQIITDIMYQVRRMSLK